MNIHGLNDLEGNNNNDNNNDNMQNNQLFLSEANPNDSEEFQFRDRYFPKQIYKIKSASFFLIFILTLTYIIQIIIYYNIYNPKGYNWGCLLFNFGASEISSVANHYNYFRIITSILTHNNFGHLLLDILSIAFIGCYVEFELKNIYNFILLFLISGIIGTFSSLLFSYRNISMGSSGAILGLCGYYILNFIFNSNRMNNNKNYCVIILFALIFINLFIGVYEGTIEVDVHSHLGGFLGGLTFSFILIYRSQMLSIFSNKYMKLIFYLCILFLIIIPIISLISININEVPDNCEFICLTQNI